MFDFKIAYQPTSSKFNREHICSTERKNSYTKYFKLYINSAELEISTQNKPRKHVQLTRVLVSVYLAFHR